MKVMIKDKLRELMSKNNIDSISKLAQKSEISKSVLHGYLQDVEPSLRNLIKLSNFFETSLDEFVCEKSSEEIIRKKISIEKGYLIEISVKKNRGLL